MDGPFTTAVVRRPQWKINQPSTMAGGGVVVGVVSVVHKALGAPLNNVGLSCRASIRYSTDPTHTQTANKKNEQK